ncbi:hypothetical protein ACH3VS_35375 [Streptomyces sp. WSLK1-3]
MSGRKRIQVDESEWYRIQRKAQQLKEVQRNIPRLIDDVRAQTRADIDRSFAGVQERQRRHEQAMSALSDQTRRLEETTTRRLREQADQLHRSLDEAAGQIRAETRRDLARQREETRQALTAEREERRAEMLRVNQEIDAIKQDRARSEEMVRAWLGDARTMVTLIADTLPHERYAPGELSRLTGRLNTAEHNAAQGRYEAALAVAQEAFHSLSDLRVDTEQRELERCSAQSEAVEALVRVEKLAEGNARRPVIGPDGQALAGYELDVVHWSHGEYEALREETRNALERARDDATDTGELLELRDQETARLEEVLGDTVERAGMRHLAAQIRVNLADAVATTLHEYAYYDLVEGDYENGDERGRYTARLRNGDNELVVDVAQAEPDSEKCVIRVLSYDHDVTSEAALLHRAQAVRQALAAEGLSVSEPECEPGSPEVMVPDPGHPSRRPIPAPAQRAAPAPAPAGEEPARKTL